MTPREAKAMMNERLHDMYTAGEIDAMMRIVMEEVMHYSPVDVALRSDTALPEFFDRRFAEIVVRLQRHEPLQYILGVARFHGLTLHVTPSTLIPRPETERLVDCIIDDYGSRDDLRVLDLGTGSGCIAVSLARALRFAQVTGVDISHEALEVARDNAARLRVRVRWLEADMLELPAMAPGSYDVVVSNPPYIAESERATMERNVLDYEPPAALFVPDDDPLVYYRAIASTAMAVLTSGGGVYVEVSEHRGERVAQVMRHAGLVEVLVSRDSYGRVRYVSARRP